MLVFLVYQYLSDALTQSLSILYLCHALGPRDPHLAHEEESKCMKKAYPLVKHLRPEVTRMASTHNGMASIPPEQPTLRKESTHADPQGNISARNTQGKGIYLVCQCHHRGVPEVGLCDGTEDLYPHSVGNCWAMCFLLL